MDQFSILLSQGASNAWWFLPTALGIGALHGLEPGHSKSLMAAFIIAVRGTWQQALVLGLCVAVSHSLIVWCIAALGLYYGAEAQALLSEGLLTQISGVLVMLVAGWMLWNLAGWHFGFGARHRNKQHAQQCNHSDHHDFDHHHDHHHDHNHDHDHDHDHDHEAESLSAHDRAHAVDIQRRFGSGQASWGQIILFGLSGGLIPCPASIAVLALCLQAKQVVIGFALVAAFSLGLALTLMISGLVAALSFKYAHKRWNWVQSSSRYAPWLSASLLFFLGGFLLFGH